MNFHCCTFNIFLLFPVLIPLQSIADPNFDDLWDDPVDTQLMPDIDDLLKGFDPFNA